MSVIGIHIAKEQLRYAVLEGSKDSPTLIAKDRLVTTDPNNVPELMDWYDSQFRQLLTNYLPKRIGYRLILEPKKDQIFFSEFPLGILNLLAYQSEIPITPYTARAFVASRLSLPKGTDLYKHCDATFGAHPPYWDKYQKNAVLVAWFEL